MASPRFASDRGETIVHYSLTQGAMMKRLVALSLGAVLAGFAVLGVVPGTAVSAAAIEEWDGESFFESNWNQAFAGADTGSSAFDGVYNWIFGPPGGGVTVDGEPCSDWQTNSACYQVKSGYAPSPAGVTSMFGTGVQAAGVTIKAGSSTVTGSAAFFNLLGASAAQLTVNESETDLEVQEGYDPDGWVFVPGWGKFAVTTTDGPLATESGAVTVTGVTSGCVYTTNTGASAWNTCMGTPNTITYRIMNANGTTSGQTGTLFNYQFCGTFVGSGYYHFPGTCLRTTPGTVPVGGYMQALTGGTTVIGTWYPEGHPSRPAAESGGLIGRVESTFVCRKPDGTSATTSASVDVSGTGEVPVSLPAFSCGADELLTSALVEWVTDTGRQTIYDYSAPDWVTETPAEWQVCGVSQACELRLYKTTGGETQYCGQYAVGCPDWWEASSGYECRYGTFVVDLNYCAQFRDPGKVSPTGTVTVGENGIPEYESPIGKPKEWFQTIPKAPPATPVTPTDPDPVPPVKPGEGDPTPDSGACFPSGWGVFNPLEWVYRPVTCALSWAFVPRSGLDQFEPIRDAFDESPFADVQLFFTGIIGALDIEGQECATLISGSPDVLQGGAFEVNTCDEALAAAGPVARTGLGWLAIALGSFGAFAVVSSAFDVKTSARGDGE